MGQFDSAAAIETVTWEMRLAEFARSQKRALINDLFNSVAPYTESQQTENNLAVNFNDNMAAVQAHGARRQLMSAIQKPNNFFTVTVDRGQPWNRQKWSSIITKNINKPLKKSLPYYEDLRSTIASVVLHGIGPSVWHDQDHWRPHARGVEDILVPSNTLVSMENMAMFAVYEPMTAMQLFKLTSGPNIDPAWNMPLVNRLIADAEAQVMEYGIPYSESYMPEKQSERRKEDSGLYASDSLATINTITFYFWNDEKKQAGWNKRIVLDANWTRSGQYGRPDFGALRKGSKSQFADDKGVERSQFLYNPGSRKYADSLGELIHFQFGDLSPVGPFRYHSVRSLGQLLYAPCNIQNRLHCSFLDAVFEQLMQYYRVKSIDDYQRALKVDLVNKGYIDDTVQFVRPEERWKIDQNLSEFALAHNENLIAKHGSIYNEKPNDNKSNVERKEIEVMAQIHSQTALVGAALSQAYIYQEASFQEICRRFSKKNSSDKDVRQFRVACLRDGVPEDVLNYPECWEVAAEKIMGAGNKTLETAIANQLMAWRPAFDPEPQREILRASVLAITDDADMAMRLVPEDQQHISNSVHDAQLAAGTLMQGLRVDARPGQNHIEVIETMLGEFAVVLQKVVNRGGMATPDEINGMNNMANYIGQQIQLLAQDPAQKQRVKIYTDDLANINNEIRALQQRLEAMMKAKAAQNGQAQVDPKDKAKILGTVIQAKAKAEISRESHAQRTSQRKVQADMKMQQSAEAHALELQKQAASDAQELTHQARSDALELAASERELQIQLEKQASSNETTTE